MTKAKQPKAKESQRKEGESTPRPVGRPKLYSKELASKICRAISTSTDGLRKMVSQYPEFPSHTVIHEWRLDYPEFADQYATAKRIQAELLAEEIIDISDDDSRDEIEDESGQIRFNSEFAARSRIRIDSRKWIACKLLPKVYGDRVTNDTTVTFNHEKALSELE